MPIVDIIHEIDAYLLCLRHARDLLSAPVTESRGKRAHRSQRKVQAAKADHVLSSKPRIQKNRSRSDRPALQGKVAKKRADSVSPIRNAVTTEAAVPEKLRIAATERAPRQAVERIIASPGRHKSPVKRERRSAAKPASRAKLDDVKPAIALAGSMSSKIVVVSAEQAQRERKQVAQSEVRRPRVPAAGLTGRLAFEALFKDATDSASTSEGKQDGGERNSTESGSRPSE